MNFQEQINRTEKYGTLRLEFNEYDGLVIISNPITIEGNNSIVCSKKGPVIIIDSEDVTIKDLSIEVTERIEDQLSQKDDTLALLAKKQVAKLDNIMVKGNVKGIINEDGLWNYPELLNLWPVLPEKKNYFEFSLSVPVSCALETDIDSLKIVNPGLTAGKNKIILELNGLKKETILFGYIKVKSTYLSRMIGISGGSFAIPKDIKPNPDQPLILTTASQTPQSSTVSQPLKKIKQSSQDSSSQRKNRAFWFIMSLLLLIVVGGYFFISKIGTQDLQQNHRDPAITVGKIQKDDLRQRKEQALKKKQEAQRLASEKAKAQQLAREKEEARQMAKEKANAQQLARAEADAQRIAKEKEEAKLIAIERTEAQVLALKNKNLRLRIESDLKLAQTFVRQGKFVKPKGKNAFEIYEDLLNTESEFGKEQSRIGLKKIFNAGHYYLNKEMVKNAANIFAALRHSKEAKIKKRAIDAYEGLTGYYDDKVQNYKNNDECLAAKKILEKIFKIFPGDTDLKQRIKSLEKRTGELSIYSEPWGSIIVNGVDIKQTSPANRIKLICGTHQLSLLNHQGGAYSERKTEVKIRFGKLTKLIMIRDRITELEE